MTSQDIALKIYKQVKPIKDRESAMLKIFSIVTTEQDCDFNEVKEIYEKIQSGQVLVAQVISRTEIPEKEKNELESKIKQEFTDKELIFEYSVQSDIQEMLKVKIGDRVLSLDI